MNHLFSICNGNRGVVGGFHAMSTKLKETLENDYDKIEKGHGDERKQKMLQSNRD